MSDSRPLNYCPDLLHYSRRLSRVVNVGHIGIGGSSPIRVQSMITSDTRDTKACVAEVLGLAEVGCEIVRITAQTKVYAANLEHIAREVRAAGCMVPLVADIHFKPDAALEAAKWVEKIRVNPGNYADKKKFEIREYSDNQYEEELDRIREQFSPLVGLCKDLGRAMRIGTNHGSLSDRIMNRYGDTPLGMVESALEFARIARDHDYHQLVFSMKASNPKVMIEAYRLLVARLQQEGPDWNYPIHLGVTEAGDGEDGRIKSAIGIGSLLADGIGDTIRVSLTEDSIHEIPVAQALARHCGWSVPLQSVEGASRSLIQQDAEQIRPDWAQLSKCTSTFLPHWCIPGATYAVTFRLADSIPQSALDDFRQRKSILLAQLKTISEKAGSRDCIKDLLSVREQINDLQQTNLEQYLNAGHGECLLSKPALADLVEGALKHFDGERYDLLAWSIMPNHVHAILRPKEDHNLDQILHTWKSFTAKKINRSLGRTGAFWQEEYYDHVIRDGEDLKSQIRYVIENPGKGNSSNQWTSSRYGNTWDEILGAGRSHHGPEQDAPATFKPSYDPFSYERRRSSALNVMGHDLGGEHTVRVFTTQDRWNALAERFSTLGDFKPEVIFEKSRVIEIDPTNDQEIAAINANSEPSLITVADHTPLAVIPAFRLLAARADSKHPILLKDTFEATGADTLQVLLQAAQNLGSLLCDGIGDAILVRGEAAPGGAMRLSYNILQAAGTRIFKTDYVACPSCGRTLFNLQSTTQKIREATGHLKGVRIAVMGCIVNGPGEMADADFGYVGGAPGKINLYVGKTAVEFNIPEQDAVDRLTKLIREHGKWVEPEM